MATFVLLVTFLLSGSFPARAQDTRIDQAGSVLREYVDKGYCTYTYVVPPGSRTEGCTPPGLERQLAETKEETGRLKNQVDHLSSLVQTLLSRVESFSAELSEEKVRSAQLEQNLTQELQQQETRLQTQCTCEWLVPDRVVSTTTASLPSEGTATTQPSIPPPATESTGPVTVTSDTWTEYNFTFHDNWNACHGKQYVKLSGFNVGKYVGVVLCSAVRYKIFLSDELDGMFLNVADGSGHGQDHCEFLGVQSDTTAIDNDFWRSPSTVGYSRSFRGDVPRLTDIGGHPDWTGQYYPHWYECGISIP